MAFRYAEIMPVRSCIINNILWLFLLFRPSRLRRFKRSGLALCRRHAGRPRRPALQSAQPPQRHRRRILCGFCSHAVRMTQTAKRLKEENILQIFLFTFQIEKSLFTRGPFPVKHSRPFV